MPIDYEKRGKIAYITFRNGKVNPTTPAMHKQFYEVMNDFLADDGIHAGILAGAGTRAFSAGDDIKNSYSATLSMMEDTARFLAPKHRVQKEEPDTFAWSREVLKIERFKPIVAAVRGYCLGQAMINLCHLTDIRVASEDARFGFPEIAYGMGGAGGTSRFLRHVPYTVGMEMLLTGDPLSAQDALRVNLVNAVVPSDKVMEVAESYAERITRHPLLSIRVEMEASLRAMDMNKNMALDYTKMLYRIQRMAVGPEKRVSEFLYK